MGRLAEGVAFHEARASMEVVTERFRNASPANEDIRGLLAQGVGLDPGDEETPSEGNMKLTGIAWTAPAAVARR